jgi:phosphopantetheinyl transferase
VLEYEIAARCGVPPDEVSVVSAPGRPPAVAIKGRLDGGWQVSFSHTRGCVLGALAVARPVGVDTEWIDLEFNWRPVAAEFFPPKLIRRWERRSPDEARREFFLQWVRWEAALKCRGTGFDATHLSPQVALRDLEFSELTLGEDYVGCLARGRDQTSGIALNASCFPWTAAGDAHLRLPPGQ